MTPRIHLLALALAPFFAGCGYTFAAAPGLASLSEGRSVDVAPMENASLEADAGIIATRAAARAIVERGGGGGSGTLRLSGTVESVNVVPAYIGGWHVDARLRLQLIDPKDNRIVAHSSIAEGESYSSADDVEGTEANRRLATIRLLERMVAHAIDRLAR